MFTNSVGDKSMMLEDDAIISTYFYANQSMEMLNSEFFSSIADSYIFLCIDSAILYNPRIDC